MSRSKRLPAALAGLLAAACAGYPTTGLSPGTSEAQVRQAMGPPALELAEPGGGRELVYPHGPLGTETFMAHLDADGALRGVEQVLTDEHFQAIQPGQTEDEVLRRLGPPGEKMPFSLSGNVAWTWRYIDAWGYTSDFSATFAPDGRVVDKISVRLGRRDAR